MCISRVVAGAGYRVRPSSAKWRHRYDNEKLDISSAGQLSTGLRNCDPGRLGGAPALMFGLMADLTVAARTFRQMTGSVFLCLSKDGIMKDGIHPDYHEINVVMTDGTEFKPKALGASQGIPCVWKSTRPRTRHGPVCTAS